MQRDNHELRDLPSTLYGQRRIPQGFGDFCTAEILPHITLAGRYKVATKQALAIQCLHNLVVTGLAGRCVSDTRGNTKPGVRLRAAVWAAIVAAGYAAACLGSEASHKVTRYAATRRLLKGFERWSTPDLINTNLTRGTQTVEPDGDVLVLLKDTETHQPIPIPPEHLATTLNGIPVWSYLATVEDTIEYINRANARHRWEAFRIIEVGGKRRLRSFPANFHIRQVHSGEIFRCARLYTWTPLSAQNLSKEERRLIRIDGEAVAELDFAGMHTRMLYHFIGQDPEGDIYRPEVILPRFYGFENATDERRALARDLVKRATNICWNTSSRAAAQRAVWKSIDEHPDRSQLQTLIRDIEETTHTGIIDRIYDAHPALTSRFFSNTGGTLQTADGIIMLNVLRMFAKTDRPALGLHDGLLCRVSDADFGDSWMQIFYHSKVGHFPQVRRVY